MSDHNQRTIAPLPASHPELGRWLWALEDTRRRTLGALLPFPDRDESGRLSVVAGVPLAEHLARR